MPQRRKRVQARRGPITIRGQGSVEIQAAAGGGQLRRFKMTGYTGAAMRIGWFEYPVVVDLAGMTVPSKNRPVLRDHDSNRIVGHSDTIEVGNTLEIAGIVSGAGPDAEEVVATSTNGFPWQASIGAVIDADLELVEQGVKVTVNARQWEGPILIARKTTLQEISFVPNGADANTSATVGASALQGAAMPTFEEWVASLGFVLDDLTEQQSAALKIAYTDKYPDQPAEDNPPPADTPPAAGAGNPAPAAAAAPAPITAAASAADLQAARQQAAAEVERRYGISQLCAAHNGLAITVGPAHQRRTLPLEAHAIAEGWDLNRTELEILRVSRPQGPAIIARGHDQDCTAQALQGALILRARGRLDHPSYTGPRALALGLPAWLRAGINDAQRNRAMEAAHGYADLSAVDLCREFCRLDGRDAPRNRRDLIRAAFSGSSLTNAFTTNVNAILLATYEEAGDSTEAWTQATDVADFKTQERVRLTKGPGLSRLPRGQEADHTRRADVLESYKIGRYATQFQVDEQDIIDDMLNALADIPVEMGRAAARLRPDLVYSILISNPTLNATSRQLFNSTDNNIDTTSALSSANLRQGVANMLLVTENSVNLNVLPTHLIVPPTLKHLADELINSSQILIARGGTTDTSLERGNINALQADGLQRVTDARLENGVTDPASLTVNAGSTSTWFLAASNLATIEVAYLRGTGRAPQVRSFVLDRGMWGIGWDINLDIGAKAMDWRGLYKATA